MKTFKILLLALFSISISPLFAQADSSVVLSDEEVYAVVEETPRFPGCEGKGTETEVKKCSDFELLKYVTSAECPTEADNDCLYAKIYVKFIVDESGKVTEPELIESSGNEHLDKAAIAHVQAMPLWRPGYKDGAAVKVQFAVPVSFAPPAKSKKKKKKK